jgi:hypothetical protein
MEHRWGNRHEVSKPVRLGTKMSAAAEGRICNASMSGAFVLSVLPVRLFSYIRVQFTVLLNGQWTTTAVEGQVVRKDATGFGIEWRELASEAVRALVAAAPRSQREIPQPSLYERSAAIRLSSSSVD